MTAAHDHEDLQRLIDRLPPAQVRRLRSLVAADPELSTYVEPAAQREQLAKRPGLAAFVGSFDSGRGDLAERHEELIRDGLDHSR